MYQNTKLQVINTASKPFPYANYPRMLAAFHNFKQRTKCKKGNVIINIQNKFIRNGTIWCWTKWHAFLKTSLKVLHYPMQQYSHVPWNQKVFISKYRFTFEAWMSIIKFPLIPLCFETKFNPLITQFGAYIKHICVYYAPPITNLVSKISQSLSLADSCLVGNDKKEERGKVNTRYSKYSGNIS